MDKNRIKVFLEAALVVIALLLCAFLWLSACGVQEPKVVYEPGPNNPVPTADCGGAKLGDTKTEQCQAGWSGDKLVVCSERGWETKLDTCRKDPSDCQNQSNGKVSFEQIKPILSGKCVSCHNTPERYDEYAVAKRLSSDMIYRINLPTSDPSRMPRSPNPELSFDEKQLFEKWRNDGLIEKDECVDPDPNGQAYQHLDLDYIEGKILDDLNRLDSDGQKNSRYLVLSHKYDQKSTKEDMALFVSALDKTINSVSGERDTFKVSPVDSRATVFRVDLRAYKLNAADWQLVLDAEPFKFDSKTSKGLIIRQLTGTDIPWLHGDNFAFTSHGVSSVYYALTRTPATEAELQAALEANFAVDVADFEANLIGFNGSPISLQKNRLLARVESEEGYYWQTFDPNTNFVAEKNLFQFPLLVDAGGVANFQFDASEVIYSLKNGLQAYALFNNAGVRQDAAPLNVVADNRSPFTPEIVNAISCHRCHAGGLLTAVDQVRDSVGQNAAQFLRADVEKVEALYKRANSNSALFSQDIRFFQAALAKLGIPGTGPDPINFLTDKLRQDFNVQQAAAFTFLEVDEFKRRLNQSAVGKAQIGQLLNTNGTVTFAQFVETFPIIKDDFRLGQDPIDQ